jgi:predicted  nucleic acid-binding Zn-ribbon protein
MSDAKDAKDLVIENLRKQIEQYKEKLTGFNFENLTSKISTLEKQVIAKDQEIQDLRASSSQGMSDTELRTKNLMLTSKVRALEQKISELNAEKENLELKTKRLEKEAGKGEELDSLKRQLRLEMENGERLRNQFAALNRDYAQVQQIQQENAQLRAYIDQIQRQGIPVGGNMATINNSSEIQRLYAEIQARDQKIAQLESSLQSNSDATVTDSSSGSPMANLRMQREITALKSQIQMLKKSEADLQKKYQELSQKTGHRYDDSW